MSQIQALNSKEPNIDLLRYNICIITPFTTKSLFDYLFVSWGVNYLKIWEMQCQNRMHSAFGNSDITMPLRQPLSWTVGHFPNKTNKRYCVLKPWKPYWTLVKTNLKHSFVWLAHLSKTWQKYLAKYWVAFSRGGQISF